jgi:Type I phosphodiesterase / nucleotide pyrophosphatase
MWHLGMIGHGSYLPGGDKDIAVLDDFGGVNFRTNPHYYTLPGYLDNTAGLTQAVSEVDRRDGKADNRWLGNPIFDYDPRVRYTPAWSIYQSERIVELLRRERFGHDSMPDLFFTNYKTTDLAGHQWWINSPEERDDLAEQDRQVPLLIRALNHLVGRRNYVLAITADHGLQPPPSQSHGWSIDVDDMTKDIERHFDTVSDGASLVRGNRGYQIFLNHREMRENHVGASDVAAFVRNYRIEDNIAPSGEVPPLFADRVKERLYLTALTPRGLRAALKCARRKATSPR